MHSVAWSAAAMATHPEIVRAIHEDYLRAGAGILITNSFGTSRHRTCCRRTGRSGCGAQSSFGRTCPRSLRPRRPRLSDVDCRLDIELRALGR